MTQRIAYFSLLLIVLHACSGKKETSSSSTKSAPPPVAVEAYITSPQAISKSTTATGSLLAFESTPIHPEGSGLVTAINFREGSYVKRGQVLVTLKADDLRAQLKKLYVQQKTAEKTVERYAELLKIDGVSRQDYDINVLALNSIKADIAIVNINLAKTRVLAPYSGIMGLRNISLGAYVTPQTEISTLRQTSSLKLDFNVPEQFSSSMRAGGQVFFTVNNSAKKYLARIIATENFITEENRSLKVRAVVDGGDANLIAGQFANIDIPLGDSYTSYMIPSQAVIPKARNKEVILVKDGVATPQIVTTGIRDSARVEIITGLKAGDTVLLTGLLSTKPGAKVKISKVISK